MFMTDGREHVRLRRQVNSSFTPQRLDAWLPYIRRTMRDLLDRVQPRGRMDVVAEICHQLPPLVIAEFFGVPVEDRGDFLKWTGPIAQFSTPSVGADRVKIAEEATKATHGFIEYVGTLVEKRRRDRGGTDALSQMLHEQEGGGLTTEELLANAFLILFAGHTTTTDQLSNGLNDLLTHPDQLQKLREDPSLIKSTVEEIIRYNPAVPYTMRVAAEEFQFHGKTIRKGDLLFLGMASANRDPEIFPEPDRFDITRNSMMQKHLSFGFGPHTCLGMGLARRELEVAIEELVRQLPALALDETQQQQLKWQNLSFRGFAELHVRW
jgi:cytochrome P450